MSKLDEATVFIPADEYDALRTAVAFFASVIKSGESWSPTCEEAYRKALEPKEKE